MTYKPKKCCMCDVVYTPNASNQQTCSVECRLEMVRTKAREKAREQSKDPEFVKHRQELQRIRWREKSATYGRPRACVMCGIEFMPYKGQKSCSAECGVVRKYEKERERMKNDSEYREHIRQHANALMSERRNDPEFRAKEQAYQRARNKAKYVNDTTHRQKCIARAHKQRTLNKLVGDIDLDAFWRLCAASGWRCAKCGVKIVKPGIGVKKYDPRLATPDHIIPRSWWEHTPDMVIQKFEKCGWPIVDGVPQLNHIKNLQPFCHRCNSGKNNRDCVDYRDGQGGPQTVIDMYMDI